MTARTLNRNSKSAPTNF